MAQYILKSALAAEIDKRISQLENKYKELSNFEVWTTAKEIKCKINGLKEALSIINTLEVKEVDLEDVVEGCIDFYEDGPIIDLNKNDITNLVCKYGLKQDDKIKVITIKQNN